MRGVADNVFVSSGIVRQKKVNTYCSAQYFPSVDVNQNGVFAMQNRFKLPVFGNRLCLQFFVCCNRLVLFCFVCFMLAARGPFLLVTNR